MAYNNLKVPWETVKAMRDAYAKGEASICQLAKLHKLTRRSVSQIIHGALRQTEQSRIPIFARLSRNELLRHPSGKLFPRRPTSKGRRLIVPQIPFVTIVQIRHEYDRDHTSYV